eukprot:250236-Chlamydomonas_euryale.AAC.1
MSATEVVAKVVRPATAPRRCRYADEMRAAAPAPGTAPLSAGRRFFFVSYAWGSPFGATVRALAGHFAGERQAVWRAGQPALELSQVWMHACACVGGAVGGQCAL